MKVDFGYHAWKFYNVAFHINQRDEGIDLNGVSGALMATRNMQMQTFVTQPEMVEGERIPIAFAANQRDEVRDLHDVAGTLGSQPGMKQQTFIAAGNPDVICLNDRKHNRNTPSADESASAVSAEYRQGSAGEADAEGIRKPWHRFPIHRSL